VLQDTTESRTSGVVVQVQDKRGCHLCNGLLADNCCTQATMRLTMGSSRWTRNPSQ
jgi:hypothetical protein